MVSLSMSAWSEHGHAAGDETSVARAHPEALTLTYRQGVQCGMTITEELLTVGAVAELAGLTIRTLHHYDEIGLLRPVERSAAGYRLYGHADLERLQEVLFFRELGFGLEKIRDILSRPDHDRISVLLGQREMLTARADRLRAMIEAIDMAIEARRTGMTLSREEMLEVFDGFDPTEYAEEAEARWGATDPYVESVRRTKRYTKADWSNIKAEGDEVSRAFLELMAAGVMPDAPEAREVAERHRAHITRWFYDCSREIHAGLGRMYVADPRFTKNIDRAGEGLAAYMSEAIVANAARE